MISRKRKRKISLTKIRKLRELYLLGISIRKVASVVKVNKTTVERYFRGFSDAICKCVADNFCKSSGEVEVDESYSAKRPLGLAGVERVREAEGLGEKLLLLELFLEAGSFKPKSLSRQAWVSLTFLFAIQ